jgi:YgiT-type zinc finger domain-containing protein
MACDCVLFQDRQRSYSHYRFLSQEAIKDMNTYSCSNCGADVEVKRGNYEFHESGLDYVVLHNVELITCLSCGNADPIIRSRKKLFRNLLVAVAGKPEPLGGQDLRFIRKQLGMTQEAFARLIRTDKTKISKWETEADPIGPQSDLLIRAIAVSLTDDVPKALAKQTIEQFQNIAAEHTIKTVCMDADKDYALSELC